jgi:hypothetical protein|eukprot:COSAG01_NODE_4101_length_5346_cov_7.892401_3_plen_61_part_00
MRADTHGNFLSLLLLVRDLKLATRLNTAVQDLKPENVLLSLTAEEQVRRAYLLAVRRLYI